MRSLLSPFVVLALTTAMPSQSGPEPATGRARVLFVTQSSGFAHAVVKRVEAGKRALAERMLVEAAGDHFVVECTQDASELTRERLAEFACVVFYTTGELPIPEPAALIGYVESGGGFVGVHSATDTFYEFPDYGRMIGGYFDGHPWNQEVNLIAEVPGHPVTAHLGGSLRIADEIYQHRDWSRDGLQVLLRVDPESVDISKGKRSDGDYAALWCKPFGKGRVLYNALGHRHEVWANPAFLRSMVAGIRWAMGGEKRFAARPEEAVTLFDGGAADAFEMEDGEACQWKVVDGALEVEPGTGSVVTKDAWQDFVLHVGFQVPDEPGLEHGQRKGNSGVYLQQRYEVQILDSFGLEPEVHGCGAIYGQRTPDVNATRPPGEWQDYWIAFRAARFDADGQKTENARVTVVHNGVIVHDGVELTGKTGAGQPEGPETLSLLLQDHGNRVRFRDIWLLPR